jgi:hypothetical protein
MFEKEKFGKTGQGTNYFEIWSGIQENEMDRSTEILILNLTKRSSKHV